MLSLRAHIFIFLGILAAIIALAAIGSSLQATGTIENPDSLRLPMIVIFSLLAAALAFSAIPVMVKLVLGFQKAVGNRDVGFIKAMLAREKHIIWAIWALMAAGLVIAIPAAILNSSPHLLTVASSGPSEGRLVAAPGLTIAEMTRQSTLKLQRNADLPEQNINPLPIAGGANFDFEIAGTGFVIPNCKYYFISTYTHDPAHIEAVNVGTSPHKVSRAELEQANADLRARLTAAGWLTGREQYKTEEDQTLHEGKTQGPEGELWLKNGITLDIESRRMDDEVEGEDKATAGEWIQYVEVWAKDNYPSIERYNFAPLGK